VSGSSFGYSMLELEILAEIDRGEEKDAYHSLQNRKVICSFFLASPPTLEAGDAMVVL